MLSAICLKKGLVSESTERPMTPLLFGSAAPAMGACDEDGGPGVWLLRLQPLTNISVAARGHCKDRAFMVEAGSGPNLLCGGSVSRAANPRQSRSSGGEHSWIHPAPEVEQEQTEQTEARFSISRAGSISRSSSSAAAQFAQYLDKRNEAVQERATDYEGVNGEDRCVFVLLATTE